MHQHTLYVQTYLNLSLILMLNLPLNSLWSFLHRHTDRCCPHGGAAAPFNLQRGDRAEQRSNRVQPNLHPASSTGTDVSSVQVDGKNAAAGKMAPNTAPLKGEKLTFFFFFYSKRLRGKV